MVGQAEPLQQLPVPFLRGGVDQAGAGGVGVLLLLHAGQQVVEVVGNHQQTLCSLQLLRMLLLQGHKLIDGVEVLLLNSGVGIQLSGGDFCLHQPVHAVGAAVPVGDCVADAVAAFAQQHKIHRPGVDAYGSGDFAQSFADLQAVQNALPKMLNIPAVVTVAANLAVFKAVDLLQEHPTVLHMSQDVPAAGCADVDGQIIGCHGKSPFCVALLLFYFF